MEVHLADTVSALSLITACHLLCYHRCLCGIRSWLPAIYQSKAPAPSPLLLLKNCTRYSNTAALLERRIHIIRQCSRKQDCMGTIVMHPRLLVLLPLPSSSLATGIIKHLSLPITFSTQLKTEQFLETVQPLFYLPGSAEAFLCSFSHQEAVLESFIYLNMYVFGL